MIIYHNIALIILVIIIIALAILWAKEKASSDFWSSQYHDLEKHLSHHQNDRLLELLKLTGWVIIEHETPECITIRAGSYHLQADHIGENTELRTVINVLCKQIIEQVNLEQKSKPL